MITTEIKNNLRQRIKQCDICGCEQFEFINDKYINALVLANCKKCGRRLFVG